MKATKEQIRNIPEAVQNDIRDILIKTHEEFCNYKDPFPNQGIERTVGHWIDEIDTQISHYFNNI